MPGLERFRTAQDAPGSGFDEALQEIRAGAKTGHWIWYVFPQLSGLGASAMSQAYAIADAAEAEAYLRDPTLRARLLTITAAVAEQLTSRGRSLRTLMGSEIDARKLVSSLTLFEHVALSAATHRRARRLRARWPKRPARCSPPRPQQGYARCAYTLGRLAAARS